MPENIKLVNAIMANVNTNMRQMTKPPQQKNRLEVIWYQ